MATYKKRSKIVYNKDNSDDWWRPAYDTIVTLHVLKKSNKEVGDSLKISQSTISRVLNSELGKKKIQELEEVYNKKLIESEEEKLLSIRRHSIDNIYEFVSDENSKKKKTPALFEASVKALDIVSDNRSKKNNDQPSIGSQTNVHINAILGNKEHVDRLMKGLELVGEIEARKIKNAK